MSGSFEPAATSTTGSPGCAPAPRSRRHITSASNGCGPSGRASSAVAGEVATAPGMSCLTWKPVDSRRGTTTAGRLVVAHHLAERRARRARRTTCWLRRRPSRRAARAVIADATRLPDDTRVPWATVTRRGAELFTQPPAGSHASPRSGSAGCRSLPAAGPQPSRRRARNWPVRSARHASSSRRETTWPGFTASAWSTASGAGESRTSTPSSRTTSPWSSSRWPQTSRAVPSRRDGSSVSISLTIATRRDAVRLDRRHAPHLERRRGDRTRRRWRPRRPGRRR